MLVLFVAAMGLDGVNSYLTLFPGAPHLYEPHNWLRLTTGTLEGIALAAVVLPVFNQTMWADATGERSLRELRELGLIVLAGLAVILIVLAEPPVLLYPLGDSFQRQRVVDAHAHQFGAGDHRRAARNRASPGGRPRRMLLVGLAMTLVELSTIDFGRAYVTAALSLPY